MKYAFAVLFVLISVPALAQQPPDVPTLQRAITILTQQRNDAMNSAAGALLQAATLAEENAKLKAENDELKKKTEQK